MSVRNSAAGCVVAALSCAIAVEARAQVFVASGSTNSANQTIGDMGTMSTSAYTVYWNFGASLGPGNLNPSNSASANLVVNPPFITGGTQFISGTNPSGGYTLDSGTSASGQINWGMVASYPAVSGSASPSFKITLNSPPTPPSPPSTPAKNYIFDISSVQLGSRSAATGPTKISLRYNYDDFQQDLASQAVTTTGSWQAVNLTPSIAAWPTRTIGVYGMNGTGTSSPSTPNWQIDDLRISGTLSTFTGGSMGSQTYGVTGSGVGTFSGNFSVTGTANFNATAGSTLNVTGAISGYGSWLQKDGSGLLVLSSSNSFSGQTVITAGTVQAGSAYAFGTGPIAVNDGATLDLNGFAVGNRIINRGSATILNGQNYTGAQVVTSGTVTFGSLVTGSMTIGEGGKASFNGGFGGNLSLSGSSAQATLSGQITGTVAPSQGALSIITGTVAPDAFVQVGEGGRCSSARG